MEQWRPVKVQTVDPAAYCVVSWSNVQGVWCGDIHAGRYNVASVFFVGQTTQASAVNGDQPPGKSTSNRCHICLNVINLKHELFLSNL